MAPPSQSWIGFKNEKDSNSSEVWPGHLFAQRQHLTLSVFKKKKIHLNTALIWNVRVLDMTLIKTVLQSKLNLFTTRFHFSKYAQYSYWYNLTLFRNSKQCSTSLLNNSTPSKNIFWCVSSAFKYFHNQPHKFV